MQIDCRWFLRGHLDLHCRKTVSALRKENAPALLESSERKIKISKRFWNVEVAWEFVAGCQRGDHESSKVSVRPNGAGLQMFFSGRLRAP
jgi:hypothetical protein